MAENIGGGAVGRTVAKRPSISLPLRPTVESIFRLEAAEASPNPMNFFSSFLSEDPESECRSFSQLLAGAMTSPTARVAAEAAAGDGRGRGGGLNLGQSRPMNMLLGQSPFFTSPAGSSPGVLLDFPTMFSSNSGQFGLAHQQTTHSQLQTHMQAENPSSLLSASLSQSFPTVKISKVLHVPTMTLDSNAHSYEADIPFYSDQVHHPVPLVVDKPADDGYNWRKYGQKQVKGSEYPRSYYKCTHPNCPVKKKVERSLDGQVKEIIYKGKHNHQKPPSNKRGKDANNMSSGSAELNGHHGFSINSESLSQGNAIIGLSKRDRESGNGAYEQLSGSSDGEDVGDHDGTDQKEYYGDHDHKKRNLESGVIESASHRTVTEPRIIVQTTSEVDLLDDGYRWRKYGQKVVKGNPHPRSYYKCTNAGCSVRKHVERASKDPKAVITTYEGKHNHDVPAARNSSHNTATVASNISKPLNIISTNQNIHGRSDLLNDVYRPIAVLQLKEEHKIV